MPFSGDNALSDLDLTLGAYELAAGCALNCAGFPNGSGDPELARVCERNLKSRRTDRAEKDPFCL